MLTELQMNYKKCVYIQYHIDICNMSITQMYYIVLRTAFVHDLMHVVCKCCGMHSTVFFFAVWKSAFQLPKAIKGQRQRRCHMIHLGLGQPCGWPWEHCVLFHDLVISYSWLVEIVLVSRWLRTTDLFFVGLMPLEFEVSFHHIDSPFDSHVSRLHVFCLYMFHVETTRRYASLRVATRRYVLWHLPPGVAGKDTKVAQHGLARCGRGDTVRHLVCKTWSDTWWNAWAAWRFTWLCGKLRCLLQCRRHPTVTCNSCNVITFTQTKKIRSTPLAVFSLQPLLKKIDRIR
jgi:hypothetical protein